VTRHFEDLAVGDVDEHGGYEVTAAEIRSFAERYDPQAVHLDPEAARETPFGGLVASGWHTAAMTMRLFVDGVIDDVAALGGRGVDRLRWVDPVRPGDVLSVRAEVLELEAVSEERGDARVGVETVAVAGDEGSTGESDGDGRTVLSMEALTMVRRR
jgi:acyl dehydratase